MASHIVEIYDQLVSVCIDPLCKSLDINHIDLADYNRLGPELADRIARLGPQQGLNAVIVAPTTPDDAPADAASRTRRVDQPFDVFFVWKRGATSMRDALTKYADPLHDALCSEQARRLNNLKLHDAMGYSVGHLTGFDVESVNPDPAENAALYGIGLACLSVRVSVRYIVVRDRETNLSSRKS